MQKNFKQNRYKFHLIVFIAIAVFALYGCKSSTNNAGYGAMPPQTLPVITVSSQPATTFQEYTASLEGSRDIEIRPQVDGYLDRIYVDEGAHVKKGQLLFKINAQPYVEQLNNANALYAAAKASLENAEINVNKLVPLVQNNVISDVQLKSAQAAYNVAKANFEIAKKKLKVAEDLYRSKFNSEIDVINARKEFDKARDELKKYRAGLPRNCPGFEYFFHAGSHRPNAS